VKPNTISVRRRQLVIAAVVGVATPGGLLAGQCVGHSGLLESPTLAGGASVHGDKLVLSGRVLDGACMPVAGALIDAPHVDARTVTDADGRFMLVARSASVAMQIRVSHARHAIENLSVKFAPEHSRDLQSRLLRDDAGTWRATVEIALA
jgi:protocatechuate 3,4-dioxygenase beta subunit